MEINNLTSIKFRISPTDGTYEKEMIYGEFSTDSSMSSYGLPVAIVGGEAYSADELRALVGVQFPVIDFTYPHPDPEKRSTTMSVAEIKRWEERLTAAGYLR